MSASPASGLDTSPVSLPQRRLRLRNSLVNPSYLPPSTPSSHRRVLSGSGISPLPQRKLDFEPEDNGWETDSEEQPSSKNSSKDELAPSSNRRTGNRMSTSSMFSNASTLVDSMERSKVLSPGPPLSTKSITSPRTPNSNLFAHAHHRRNRSSDGGMAGQSRYIEYLERQVADLMGQLQNYTSPTSSNSHAVKMRKLTAENRTLRNDLADWETNFNVRVLEEVKSRHLVDQSTRVRVKDLELALEDAQERRKSAEIEVKDLRKRLDDLAGIEEENRTLEFRLEAISELLQTATMSAQAGPKTPPSESRPGSIIFPPRTSSLNSSPASSRRVSAEGTCAIEDYGVTDPIPLHNIFSAFSPTMVSPTRSEARPSTAGSSTGASFVPGVPISPIASGGSPPSLKVRRMRRFPPGSSAPKTLILPSAAVVASPPGTFARHSMDYSTLSRPTSSSSTLTTMSDQPGSYTNFSPFKRPASQHNSLFAELARAGEEGSSTAPTMVAEEDESTEKEDGMSMSTISSRSSEMKVLEPSSPALSETFDVVADALHNPTPLIVKVLSGLATPSTTFVSARKHAMDMLNRVVGRSSVERVTQRRARVLASTRGRERRRGFGTPARKLVECPECGRGVEPILAASDKPLGLEAAVRDGDSLGRRRSATTSIPHVASIFATTTTASARRRSAEFISHKMALQRNRAFEDSLENMWLWVRFIVAVVVALGVAVKDGPAVVLAVDGEDIDHVREEERERALRRLEGQAGPPTTATERRNAARRRNRHMLD